MTGHSKLPWRWDEKHYNIVDADGNVVITTNSSFLPPGVIDGDYILRAVNNHDKLVNCIQSVADHCEEKGLVSMCLTAIAELEK